MNKCWFSLMEETPRRLIILSNMLYDIVNKRININKVKRIILDICDKCKYSFLGSKPELFIIKITDLTKKFYLCKGRKIIKPSQRISRVIDAFSFFKI